MNKKTKLVRIAFGVTTVVLVFLSIFVYLVFTRDFGDNYVIAVHNESGEANLLVFEISEDKITNFSIPKDTLMDVARQRGSWRMESVWKLIESEKLTKQMFSDTLIKSLEVPVNAWSDSHVLGLYSSNPIDTIKFVLNPSSSSLSFIDRVSIAVFSLGTKGRDKEDINFSETSYLSPAKLADGSEGFVRSNELSSKLRHYFVSDSFSDNPAKVEVVNKTGMGKFSISSILGTAETIGLHVLSLKEEDQDVGLYCEIYAKSMTDQVRKINEVFGCKYIRENAGNFDIRIALGKRFVERF